MTLLSAVSISGAVRRYWSVHSSMQLIAYLSLCCTNTVHIGRPISGLHGALLACVAYADPPVMSR